MFIRKILISACIISAVAAGSASARVDVELNVGAPPPPVVEAVPVERPGYAWAPGYWEWEGHRHVWRQGRYIEERPGHRWVADRWEERGPRWQRVPGHWE